MKKICLIVLCLFALTMVTGCGSSNGKEQKLICTTTEDEDGMSFKEVISMTYKNDKLKHMTM